MRNGSMALRGFVCAVLSLSIVACDGGGNGGGIAESPNLGDKAEADIVAADGGEIELADAGIKINFPAGSLRDDETITAEIVSKTALPEAAKLAGNVLELGPDGLTFAMPVELEIELPAGSVPANAETVKLVWLDQDKKEWVELPENKYEGGVVTAKTQHFSTFAVRFVVTASGAVVQEGGQCTDKFSACGGNVEGTWNITSGCVTFGDLGQSSGQCAGMSVEASADITGDITIEAGQITGTIEFATMVKTIVPKSCLPNMTCPEPGSDPSQGVYVDKGSTCEANSTDSNIQEVDSTYTVQGTKLIVTDNNMDAGAPNEPEENDFCVKGDTLQVHTVTSDGSTIEYTAKRK